MADESKSASPPAFKEELEEPDTEPRNWKGIMIALLVILSICALILVAILVLSPHLGSNLKNERLKLEDVLFEATFARKGSNATWISDTEIVYRDLDGTVMLYNIETSWKTILASNASLSKFHVEKYSLSVDRRYVLLVHDVRVQNTYSYRAKYKIYDTKNSFIFPLKAQDESEDLQFADWGPTGSSLLLVHKNNLIYYQRLGDRPQQLTSSGREGLVYNGVPDLMNEEFVLKSNKAFWWMSDGTKLCFATFDNTAVDQMPVVMYGTSNGNISREHYVPNIAQDMVYPKVINYPYPKPGRTNPLVTLWVADLSTPIARVSKQVSPPREIQGWEHYVTAVSWVDRNRLSVVWSKRSQNTTVVSSCTEEMSWICEKLFEEQLSSPKGWLELNEAPLFSEERDFYFMRLPVADGSAGTYSHVAMIYSEGNKRHFLTHGQFVVTRILAYRSDIHTLFFVATVVGEPGQRHVYSVTDMGVSDFEARRHQQCLTCDIGFQCLYNDAKFSPSAKFYILECLGPGIPRTELRAVNDNDLKEVLNTNPKLREWSDLKALPHVRYLSVPINGGNIARVRLLLPLSLIDGENTKYPAVVELDGQPGSQTVSYLNQLDWGHYLASKRDYIVVHMDVRGSGLQGDKMKHKIYHHLGEYETEDIIEVIKHLKEHLGYIDEDKIAVWGKGVGGYLVTSLLSKSSVFCCGVAVAPVTSWKNYASAYVERYMGLPWPQDNYLNYDKTDLVRNLVTMKDKQLLIVHGTADQKVNIQHSMLLMKALTDKGIPFKLQIYPDGDHSLHEERLHLHKALEDFLAECFKVDAEEEERSFVDLPLTKVIKGGKKIIIPTDD